MSVATRNRRVKKKWLAYDEFNGSALSGAWAKTDTENKVTVSGGSLVFAGGKAVPAFNDPRVTYTRASWLPRIGLTFECEMTFTAFGATGCDFGFDTTNPVTDGMQPGFQVFAGGVLRAIQAQSAIARQNTPVTLVTGTTYRFRIVLLDLQYGVLWLYSADRGKTWVPVFVDTQYPTANVPLYMGVSNNDAAFSMTYVRVSKGMTQTPVLSDQFASRTSPGRADTGQPWFGVVGKPLPTLANNDMRIASGGTEAWLFGLDGVSDGVWSGDLNFGSAPSTLKAAYMLPRWRDTNNYLRIAFFRTTQAISIARIANGTATQVAVFNTAGFLDNTTYKMRVMAVGDVIVVYQDGVEKLRTTESFGKYYALCSFYLNDNLATPDIRWDNVRTWGFPRRALFMDSFDRPDNALSLGNPDGGGTYQYVAGGQALPSTWGIVSNRAYVVAKPAGSSDGFAAVPLSAIAHTGSFVLRRASSASLGAVSGAMIRYQDYLNYVTIQQLWPSSNTFRILQNLAGTRTALSSVSLTLADDTDHIISYIFLGNTLEVYANGTRIISVIVANFSTSPAMGPTGTNSSDITIDDMRAHVTSTARVHDTFTRVDSATTMGNAEAPGTPWQTFVTGVGTTALWGITGNKAYQVSNTGSPLFSVSVVPTMVSDVDISTKIAIGAGGGSITGLAIRLVDKDNLITIRLDEAGDSVLVRKLVAGSGTTVATFPTPIATSTSYTLRVVAKGTQIQVYLNGTLIITTTIAEFTGGKLHGLFAASGSVGTTFNYDDFSILDAAA
jgi:hypothetical protein